MKPWWKENVQKPKQRVKRQQRKTRTAAQGIFLSSDPNALCECLELWIASKEAGNTGLRKEIVNICDELLRQKILSRDAHKNLILSLNKGILQNADVSENTKSAALEFFQSSKTFCQNSSVKSKPLTQL